MCGIVGQVNLDGRPVDRRAFLKMVITLKHRGPDDEGSIFLGNVALGHRRLSILDLSFAGHQPMPNEDETVWLVFNGEIYNFQELRNELQNRGHHFHSSTDSEVILHLWEEKRERCLDELRGMFAFAIWDSRTATLFCARDRVGKKPLKYVFDGKRFLFASELKALLRHPAIPHTVDEKSLASFFAINHVSSPNTGFSNVRKLPAAHYLVFEKGSVRMTRYWSPYPQARTRMSYGEACEELRRLLEESVRFRMISDVPIGAFLSGGIDSSAVAAFMSRSGEKVKTFSIGFPTEGFDERPLARTVAKALGTEHHEFEVQPSAIELLPKLVAAYEEPYADSSALPTWYLAEVTRKHVKVVLTGDGGDEAFGGYQRYRYWLLGHWFDAHLYDRISSRWYFKPPKPIAPQLRTLNEVFSYSFETFLPDDLLPKIDIATMAHGLEARSPFLDQELIEFSASLPASWKVTLTGTKRILKDALRGIVPASVLGGKKRGFELPVDSWFRGPLFPWAQSILLDARSRQRGYFSPNCFERLLREHQEGRAKHGQRIWMLLCFEFWQRIFIDQNV